MDRLEQEMQWALFGKKPNRRMSAYAAGYVVVLRVRKDYTGLPFRLEIKVRSISVTEAWVEAHKCVRVMGLVVWCVVDIRLNEQCIAIN